MIEQRGMFGTSLRPVTERRPAQRGYASSRRAYDARRRATRLDGFDRTFRDLCRRDPCAYCMAPGQDADHIVSLRSGGVNDHTNFTGSCHGCNAAKREKPLLLFLLARHG